QTAWLRLIGGAFLCYLGVRTFLAVPADPSLAAPARTRAEAYASTLLLTLTNPTTILSFVAIFAGLGVGSSGNDWAGAALLVLGVFGGSACWWLLLSSGVNVLRGRFSVRALRWVNRLSGAVIGGAGLLALGSLVV